MLLCDGSGAGKLLHVNIEWAAILSWNHYDGIIRIKNRRESPDVNFMHWNMSDEVAACFTYSEQSQCRICMTLLTLTYKLVVSLYPSSYSSFIWRGRLTQILPFFIIFLFLAASLSISGSLDTLWHCCCFFSFS